MRNLENNVLKNLMDILCTLWITTLRKLRTSTGCKHYEYGFEYNDRNNNNSENDTDITTSTTITTTTTVMQ